MAKYFVRFKSETDTVGALSSLIATSPEHDHPYRSRREPHLLIADLGHEEVKSARESGAQIYEDVRFAEVSARPLHIFRGESWQYWESAAQPALLGPAPVPPIYSLADVLNQINAPGAWSVSRGAGVTVAIVDTGIAGSMPEFPADKRSPQSRSFSYSDPWDDAKGHGSMCACAAAGTRSAGGRYDGVAPDAQLLSARTTLFSTDIYRLYDQLIDDRRSGKVGPLVISNSYGLYTCSAPTELPQDHPYLGIVRQAVENDIVVVFAAGNNHADVLCRYSPNDCSPNTIWGVNSIDEVITVGTVNAAGRNDQLPHGNSSRGPGQWSVKQNKPDVVAPTYGEIVWGGGYRDMEWWGTSGACPQVAGLAALVLSVKPSLKPAQVADIITSTARRLTQARQCVGGGLIDCRAAVEKARTL